MGATSWFIVRWERGKPIVATDTFDSIEAAKEFYSHFADGGFGFTICETVYGGGGEK